MMHPRIMSVSSQPLGSTDTVSTLRQHDKEAMGTIDLYTNSTLLRYVSEWDPRETAHTKGGYLDGEIRVPQGQGPLTMIIQTYPAADVEKQVSGIHPCLLHVVRMGKGKRDQALEPVPTHYHWKQEFLIQGGKVKILNKLSDLDVDKEGKPRNVPLVDTVTELHGNTIVMGRKRGELNLIILQPKQRNRAKNSEATLTKVLADRMGLNENDKSIEPIEKAFKGKNSKNLKKIRLRVDFFNHLGQSVGWSVSPQTVIDTGSKEIGCMDFYDASPHKSCNMGGRKIIMVSEYSLSKDVAPIFQVHDQMGNLRNDMECFVSQPEPKDINLKNQTIIFISPPQPLLHRIQELIGNFTLKLRAKRAGDGYTSDKCFNFRYTEHDRNGPCLLCDYHVDTDELVQIEEGIPRPKPKRPKRVMNKSNMECGAPGKRARVAISVDEVSLKSEPMTESLMVSSPGSQHSGMSNSFGSPREVLAASPPHHGMVDSGRGSKNQSDQSSTSDYEDFPRDLDTGPIFLLESELEIMSQNQMWPQEIPQFTDEFTTTPNLSTTSTLSPSHAQVEMLVQEEEVRNVLGMPTPQPLELVLTNEEQQQLMDENLFDLLGIETFLGTDEIQKDCEEKNAPPQPEKVTSLLTALPMVVSDPYVPTTVHMKDPMVSHGSVSVIQSVERQNPVLLQRRFIKSDSTIAEDRCRELEEGVSRQEVQDDEQKNNETEKMDNKHSPRGKQTKKQSQQSTILEEIPLLTIMFIFSFVLLQIVSESVFTLSFFPLFFLSFVLSISVIFIKNRTMSST